MDTLIRILSILIGIGIIYLVIVLIISFFLIIWPILAITVVGLTIYGGIRRYFSPPPPSANSSQEQNKSSGDGIIIDHQEDE